MIADASYPLTIDPSLEQQAYLKASNTDAGRPTLAQSVAISGDTLVVGAFLERTATPPASTAIRVIIHWQSHSGAAYVFNRNGTVWSQQAYLKASNTGRALTFGWSVAISGDTVVVGCFVGEASNATGINGDQSDNSANWQAPGRRMCSPAVAQCGASRPISRLPIH